jgi:hypothetical protein
MAIAWYSFKYGDSYTHCHLYTIGPHGRSCGKNMFLGNSFVIYPYLRYAYFDTYPPMHTCMDDKPGHHIDTDLAQQTHLFQKLTISLNSMSEKGRNKRRSYRNLPDFPNRRPARKPPPLGEQHPAQDQQNSMDRRSRADLADQSDAT